MKMEESNATKKVIFTIPLRSGDRRRGSSKLRWCEILEEDVTWVEFRNWRINTVLCFRPSAQDLKHISAIMLKILGATTQCSVGWVLG
jgi:hypothetical protein